MKCQDLREKAVIFHRLPPPLPLWIRLFFYIEMFTLKKNVSLWIERERESKREREFLSVIIIYLVITVGGRQLLARKKQHQQSGKVVCSFFLKCRKHASAHCSACFLFFLIQLFNFVSLDFVALERVSFLVFRNLWIALKSDENSKREGETIIYI